MVGGGYRGDPWRCPHLRKLLTPEAKLLTHEGDVLNIET